MNKVSEILEDEQEFKVGNLFVELVDVSPNDAPILWREKTRKFTEIEQEICLEPWHSTELKDIFDTYPEVRIKLLQIGQDETLKEARPEISIGYIIYQVLPDKQNIWLNGIAVRPKLQRKGFGRIMINHVIDLLDVDELPDIKTTVHEKNLEAQLFLKNCNFKAIDVKRGAFNDGSDGYEMVYHKSVNIEDIATD